MIRHKTGTKRQSTLRTKDEPLDKKTRYQYPDNQGADNNANAPSSTTKVLDFGNVLYDHFKALKEEMEPLQVASLLTKNGIFAPESYAKICKQNSRRLRADALIKGLYEAMPGNDKVYPEFITALRMSNQQDVIDLLQTQMKPCFPTRFENDNLLKFYNEKKTAILHELEPLDVIDDIVFLRGLHLHDHADILEADSRNRRIELLCKHLSTIPRRKTWMILKPIVERHKAKFGDTSEEERARITSSSSSSLSSFPSSSSSSDSMSGEDGPSMTLTANFVLTRKHSIAVLDSTEHDHPDIKKKEIKELERKIVDGANGDQEKLKDDLAKLMEDCTSSFKSLSFSSIRINLQSSSDTSVEQLKEFCQNGRAKSLILSLLDQDSVQQLKKMDATKVALDIYVEEKKGFLQILDKIEEGCLCTLTRESVERHFDFIVEKIEDLEIAFIERVLECDKTTDAHIQELKEIRNCSDGKERRNKLLRFLLHENSCQSYLCVLENEILMSGEAEIILRIKQEQTCKVLESRSDVFKEATTVKTTDIREHAEFLKEEIDARWFLSILQLRQDERSLAMVKIIRESQSRKDRTKLFIEYLYAEDNLHWFEESLATFNKHILRELKVQCNGESVTNKDLKLAFISAYDAITEDIEPLHLEKHLSFSFLSETDFALMKVVKTRQGRASFFVRKVLTGSEQRVGEVLEAMRNNYGDIVSTIEEILKCGSLCEKYKCPRIRKFQGKSEKCVFSTEICLFEEDLTRRNFTAHQTSASSERQWKNKLATGFVQAEITQYDKKKEYWSSYDRFNTNIGVIGLQSPCKQSLLNAMCARIETDEETAQVYVETDLKKFSSYKEARNIVFWNLPEIGTNEFPRETYLKDIDFKRYDCFAMIVPSQICLDDNILIAKEITHLHRKVVLISTFKGIIQLPGTTCEPTAHCSSVANVEEKQAETVRQNCYKTLSKLGCSDIPVFLIKEDAILSSHFDFDKLIAKLTDEVSDEKHNIE